MISVLSARDAFVVDRVGQTANDAQILKKSLDFEPLESKLRFSEGQMVTPELSSPKPLVGGLAGKIAKNVQVLERSLDIKAQPYGDQIAIQAEASGDAKIRQARLAIIDSCRTLLNLVAGPSELLKNMVLIDKHNLITLQIINHYGIAGMVPADGHVSQYEIAKACNLPLEILVRLLRQAMTYDVFCEPKVGYVAHTEVSRVIPAMSPVLSYQLEICLPSTLKLLESLKESQDSQSKASRSPFQITHSTPDTWWTYAEKSPTSTQEYGKYMALITSGGAHDVSHVVNGYDWAGLGPGTVIDVGGADGSVGIALARANKALCITIHDSTKLEEQADTKIPDGLKDRVHFIAHDFFDAQPASSKDADLYLLRHILHDWSERECVQILRALTSTMKEGARILVAEQILAPIGNLPNHTEKIMRALDMQMMVQFGSKERTLEDFGALFELADPRLRIVDLKAPSGSADTFMELMLL